VKRANLALPLACCATLAHADPPRADHEQRAAYIAGLIEAIRATDAATLVNTTKYIQVVERNKCQAPEQSLRINCMLTAATRNCTQPEGPERDRCYRVSDVIATNRLSEQFFLPKDDRLDIMGKHTDYRHVLVRELHRRHAILVGEFALSKHFPGARADAAAVGAGIEAFCRESAGTRDLSWQYCVAAIVWFVGTDGGVVPARAGETEPAK
jgi:hypothetical protein